MKKQPNFSRSNQQGAVLVVGLVTLLVLTLLGITGMRTSIMEEKMSANLISQNIALQAADSCLQRGMLDSGGFTLDDSQWQDNYQNTAMGGGATAATYGAE
ncbi:MAG: PilX N-terminal domain-containing pilus assembly protein, partial [Methylococcales bacterium]